MILMFFNAIHSFAQRSAVFDSIVHVLEKNAIYKANVDWSQVKSSIYESVDKTASDSIAQIIPAVQKLFTILSDKHGLLMYKNEVFKGIRILENRKIDSSLYTYAYDEQYAFRTKIIDGKYGYISMPSPMIPMNAIKDRKLAVEEMSKMSQQLQDSLCSLSPHDLEGIIVDLRLSLGGAYAIPISSLSPLIGNGIVFTIQHADNNNVDVKIIGRELLENDEVISRTKADCDFKDIKIAILLGPLTGSAGEQAALAFKGKSNAKFIGENTAGFLTMTKFVQLTEDLIFTYSGGYIKARDAKVYPESVQPDLLIKGGDNFKTLEDDVKIKAALTWFRE